jgi:ATP-dependent Clp protease ATP-binding subunit ClpX
MRPRNAFCSFCRRSYRDVGPLVEGPGDVYICGECVELCQSIIDQERRRRADAVSPPFPPPPEAIQNRLEELTGGQWRGMDTLAAAAHRHYQRFNQGSPAPGDTNAILLVGPTRSSKIFLGRVLAHTLDVPFAHADGKGLQRASAPPESSSLLGRLLQASEFDAEAAQRGVVYIDGVDQTETQTALLHLLENGWRDDLRHRLRLDAGGILVLCGGPFEGLEETRVGRGRHPEQPITADVLVAFGVLPELARRFQAVIEVAPFGEGELVRILDGLDLKRLANGSSDVG